MTLEKIECAYGILSGIACGDALGKMTSKYSRNEVLSLYGGRVTNLGKPLITRSKRTWEKGDITDDTILTLLISDSLIFRGEFNREDIGLRMIRCVDPRGGRQIYKLKESNNPNFIASGGHTNGPAIRVAGISIAYHGLPGLYSHLYDSSTLTHSGRESILSALIVGHVYSEIMEGRSPIIIKNALISDAEDIKKNYLPELIDSHFIKNLKRAINLSLRFQNIELCDALETDIGMTDDPCSSVVSAITLGLNYDNPRSCLVDTVNRIYEGADIDSTAAIAGGICAGLHCSHSIEDWRRVIEERNNFSIRNYAVKLVRLQK